MRSTSEIFIGSSSTFCRVSFWSLRISFTSSRNSSIRLLTLASLALTSYQISPRKAVKKPDGNHSLSPGGDGRHGIGGAASRSGYFAVDVLPVLKRRGFSGLQAAFWSVPSPSFSKALPGP